MLAIDDTHRGRSWRCCQSVLALVAACMARRTCGDNGGAEQRRRQGTSTQLQGTQFGSFSSPLSCDVLIIDSETRQLVVIENSTYHEAHGRDATAASGRAPVAGCPTDCSMMTGQSRCRAAKGHGSSQQGNLLPTIPPTGRARGKVDRLRQVLHSLSVESDCRVSSYPGHLEVRC